MTRKIVFKTLTVLITFSFIFSTNAICQCLTINLIRNPGMEDHTCCPIELGMIDCATDWTQPLIGNSSSEYYNICGIDSLLSQEMLPYWLHAHFGNGYAGIICYSYNGSFDYREYIQGVLSETLISGQCYYCEFWIEHMSFITPTTSYPTSAIDDISILFSDTLPQKMQTDEMAMYFPAQINNPAGRIISDTSNWTMISDTFTAKGGEKYFTVGAFKLPNEINQIFWGAPNASLAYYFFDNFSLCPCGDTMPDTTKPLKPILEVYPNPAKDELFILFDGYEKLSTIDLEIYNILGEMVINRQVVSSPVKTAINIGQMASGCYVVVLKSPLSTLYENRLVIIK
jgi:hypothetical protein